MIMRNFWKALRRALVAKGTNMLQRIETFSSTPQHPWWREALEAESIIKGQIFSLTLHAYIMIFHKYPKKKGLENWVGEHMEEFIRCCTQREQGSATLLSPYIALCICFIWLLYPLIINQ